MPKTTASFRFEDDELERWKSAATIAGRNLTEWLRNLANDALKPKESAEPTVKRVVGDDGLDEQQRYERALCKDCGHPRQQHRGFGTCCQVIHPAVCSCLGFDGVIVRPDYAPEVRPHSPACKCDRCKPPHPKPQQQEAHS